jgi:CheY-like chemotaxis protein
MELINRTSPYQLLLVDDSVTIQRVIRLTFADEDVDVLTFSDGNQAVAAIDKSPPDIVLADTAVPGRNGYEVARHLHDTPRLAHIPVVLLTGAFDKVDDALAAAVGCDRVLSKPFDPQVVIACVRELLARPKKIAAAATSLEPGQPIESGAEPSADVDAYFDPLDLAFADLAVSRLSADTGQPDDFAIELVESPEASAAAVELPDLPAGVEPLSYASDQAAFDYPSPAARGAPASTGAEDADASGLPAPFRLVESSGAVPAVVVTDELIEELATRVLDRLMVRLSSGNVPEVVAAVTERLVRAEIEKIKSRL